jgi:X-Pro dipeptidyl-peptidase
MRRRSAARTQIIALSAALTVVAATAAPAAAADPPGPIFDPTTGVTLDLPTELRASVDSGAYVETDYDSDGDGKNDLIHFDITRPTASGPAWQVPVIMEASPYYGGSPAGGVKNIHLWDITGELNTQPPLRASTPFNVRVNPVSRISTSFESTWVKRGYAVMHMESVGTGTSEGCATIGDRNEDLAPAAVIDWLNGRRTAYTDKTRTTTVPAPDWHNGKTAMIGVSYNGTLPLAAATTGVEGLELVVPQAPNTSYYDHYYSQGLVRAPGDEAPDWNGEDIDQLFDYNTSSEFQAKCGDVRTHIQEDVVDRVTGDYNENDAIRDYSTHLENVHAAVLLDHGLNDYNVKVSHSTKIYAKLKELGKNVSLHLSRGPHGGSVPDDKLNRWFSHYLYGSATGVENDQPVQIERQNWNAVNPDSNVRNQRSGIYDSFDSFPLPDSRDATLTFAGGGLTAGSTTMLPSGGEGTKTFTDDALAFADQYTGTAATLPDELLARSAESQNRLQWITAPLKEDIHISGTPWFDIRLAVDDTAANLSAYLLRVPADGGSWTRITRGWADPQNRGDRTTSSPLVPNEFVQFPFTTEPDDLVLKKGDRIAIDIFSSDYTHTLRPPAGRQLTVDLDNTALHLPVVGGASALATALGTFDTVDVQAATECRGSKAQLIVSATNGSSVPVAVGLSTDFGTKSFNSLKPGHAQKHPFNTQTPAPPADEVAVSITATVGGEQVTVQRSVPYDAGSC